MKILSQLNTTEECILLIDGSNSLSKNLINKLNLALNSNSHKVVLINPVIQKNGLLESLSLSDSDLFNRLEILNRDFQLDDLLSLGRSKVKNIVDRVFVLSLDNNANPDKTLAEIYNVCVENRIPINTANSAEFSTFSLLSTYNNENLQIGVTTNLQGCKMSSRLKRELIKSVPPNINEIIENVSNLRKSINSNPHLNKREKLKWLSQIIDYYPLNELGQISLDKLNDDLNHLEFDKLATAENRERKGKISLIGSGPGSISNLTIGALNAIHEADLILADKLVPQEILDLIPKNVEVFIARKFPGNAEKAQEELLKIGLENIEKGLNVVRLKQGDPYIFGRGGEEFLFFQKHGYKVNVLCGLSSAFVATANAGIPTTHRGVADQVMICTGVGRHGKIPDNLPIYEEKRTVIFLMSIKRIVDILPILTEEKSWPSNLPVAVVERASCGDERIIRTRLGSLISVCNKIESRPPGLIITGWACDVYSKLQDDEEYRIIESGLSTAENVDLGKIVGLMK